MKVFSGTLVHSTWEDPFVLLPDSLLAVSDDGKIVFVDKRSNIEELRVRYGFTCADVRNLSSTEFVMPGMIDTHLHAPQFPNCGVGHDLPLLEWLETYTFPEEAKFSQHKYANTVYDRVVDQTLRNGTTTALYFASIHTDASLLLCDVAERQGQRALVGKVNMDANSPETYSETTEESLRETKRFVDAVKNKKYRLCEAVITPRFAISCTDGLMRDLGRLASDEGLRIQSHISENEGEMEFVKKLFPDSPDYSHVYLERGLLNDKTVMAHGVYLSDSELKLFKQKGAAISHCPNSNLSIHSGLMDLRRALNAGVTVGLGTDCSGGSSPTILDAIRLAVHTSSVHRLQRAKEERAAYKAVGYTEAFRLATLGGAHALGMSDRVGSLEVGKEFDALVIDTAAKDSPIFPADSDTSGRLVEKFLFCGDDRNIVEVYVAGKQVKSR